MTAALTEASRPTADPASWGAPRRVAVVRGLLALVWAAALIAPVGDRVPSTSSELPIFAALVLATYPLIDVVASVIAAVRGRGTATRLAWVDAGIGALAVAAVAATAFGSDAGAVLVAFGAWAAVSGALQFAVAVRERRAHRGQLLMLVSGGLSTIAGLSFVASSRMDDARLATLGGYMALGAALFLLSAWRGRPAAPTTS